MVCIRCVGPACQHRVNRCAAREGVLYSKDGASLLYFPAAAGNAVVLPAETESIGEGAFAQAEGLASIVALGYVRDIHETAFAEAAKRDAQVALPAGENYDTRKVVWEAAGFQSFVEPAAPGDAVGPTDPEGQPASGFVFTLLDDYTLAVSWVGESDPEADLVIPATAKLNDVEYRVSAIAPAGFQGRQSLSSVQIRAPITVIGDDAFTGCTGLASVELSEGVSAIGAGAFSGTAVQRVVIPASVTSVGSRAFADCPDLSRIVTFSNAPSVDADAIAGCTGVAIYAPYDEAGEYPWNPGLVASGNHILPYGISLASDPLALEVGETADLFEGGVCEVPDGCELTYSYAATPISVEAGQVTGKKIGVSEVTAVLSLDGIELARIMRVVEVVAGKPTPYIFDADGTYTFRFDSLGGTSVPDQKIYMTGIASGGPTSSSHYNMTPNITKPQDPSKPGYTFVGWSIRSHPEELYNFGAGSAEFDSGDFVSGIVTFYAKWKRVVPQGATTGTIGDGVTWYITSTNELIITPTNGISGTLPASYAESYIPWANNSTIKVATIDSGVKANESLGYLFYGNSALTEIKGLDSLITSGVKKVAHMLHGCSSLSFLDVSKWDTSNLFVAYSLFANCSRLSSIDVSGWNTPKLTQTTWMFSGCTSLTSLDFSSWDTSKVSAMGRMFNDCTNLTSLDLLGFDTSVVTINEGMFANCSSLSSLDLSTWSLPVNTNMDELFADCSKLTFLDISSLDTSKLPGSAVGVFRNCPSLSEVKVGSNYTLKVLSKPMMNGYTGNWINSSGKSFAYNAIPSGVADTYRAQTSYNIAFNGNGSTGGSMAVQTVPHGMSVNLTSNGFTKTGHTFAGWAESATGAVKYANGASVKDLTSTPNGTVTLYAKWTPITYQVTFNANNGDGTMQAQTITYGTSTPLSHFTFTRLGYTFAGWAESATATKAQYTDQQSVLNLRDTQGATVALYAVWEPNSYQVVFHANYPGNANTTTQDFKYNETNRKLNMNPFAHTGWTFEKWTTNEDGSGTSYANQAAVTTPLATQGSYHLYAQWTRNNYDVTFNSNGGSYVDSQSVGYGNPIPEPQAPKLEGYTFDGWYADAAFGGSPWNFTTGIMPEGGLTLYAKWTANTYTVTFDANGGSVSQTSAVTVAGKLTTPSPTQAEVRTCLRSIRSSSRRPDMYSRAGRRIRTGRARCTPIRPTWQQGCRRVPPSRSTRNGKRSPIPLSSTAKTPTPEPCRRRTSPSTTSLPRFRPTSSPRLATPSPVGTPILQARRLSIRTKRRFGTCATRRGR